MKTITGQILAGTRLDQQGERNSKDSLERYASAFAGKRQPLNQHHDLSLPVIGYIENFRVVADDVSPGDWQLVGDVFFHGDTPPEFGGFSFSYTEKLRRSQSQEYIEVFLPYPHYNDQSLIDEVFEEGYASVGRVVRKGLSPETVALIAGVTVAVVQPLWEDFYRSCIAPVIRDFFQKRLSSLRARNISCDVIQYIDYGLHRAQVIFIPVRGMELECFSIDKQCHAMFMVFDYLTTLDINHVPAAKVILIFNKQKDQFFISSVHFTDGSVSICR